MDPLQNRYEEFLKTNCLVNSETELHHMWIEKYGIPSKEDSYVLKRVFRLQNEANTLLDILQGTITILNFAHLFGILVLVSLITYKLHSVSLFILSMLYAMGCDFLYKEYVIKAVRPYMHKKIFSIIKNTFK
jgi:hypothetical protein